MKDRAALMLPVLLVAAVLALLFLFGRSEEDRIDRGPLGFDGLALWLEHQGIETGWVHRRRDLSPDAMALRILPVYDTAFYEYAADATPDSPVARRNLRDLDPDIVVSKARNAPTMLALPKWQRSVMDQREAAPDALIPVGDIDLIFEEFSTDMFDYNMWLKVQRSAPQLVTEQTRQGFGSITLYHAQLFNRASLPSTCTERAGIEAGVLIASCRFDDGVVHLLSDPDAMNNHGLSLGDNAATAERMIESLISGRAGLVAMDRGNEWDSWDAGQSSEEPQKFERDASDLARFFEPPLRFFWLSAVALLLLAIWRGQWRFGPPEPLEDDGHAASKSAAIAAKARLLRISGHDREIARHYARARLQELAADLLGPDRAQGEEALWRRVARRDLELAAAAKAANAALQSCEGDGPELSKALADFDREMGRVADEFRRI